MGWRDGRTNSRNDRYKQTCIPLKLVYVHEKTTMSFVCIFIVRDQPLYSQRLIKIYTFHVLITQAYQKIKSTCVEYIKTTHVDSNI